MITKTNLEHHVQTTGYGYEVTFGDWTSQVTGSAIHTPDNACLNPREGDGAAVSGEGLVDMLASILCAAYIANPAATALALTRAFPDAPHGAIGDVLDLPPTRPAIVTDAGEILA